MDVRMDGRVAVITGGSTGLDAVKLVRAAECLW